jgi:glycosyltransferase involved in cell wall biosynthesis
MPDVTVVLPVWDGYVLAYLDETLDSLRAQLPRPRILLVDNCSRVPLPRTSDIDVVRTPRRLSVGAARSQGLAQVDSEFVIFWDADDIMPPRTIATLRQRMSADRQLTLLAATIVEGSSARHHWPRHFTPRLARRPGLFAFVHSISSLVPTVGAMMRTDAARDAGGFADLETGDDWVLGVSLAFRGRVDVVDHVGRIYRQHSDSVWSNRQTTTHLFAHARAVRDRIATDPKAPASFKRLLALIALGQWVVIRVLRPIARVTRT